MSYEVIIAIIIILCNWTVIFVYVLLLIVQSVLGLNGTIPIYRCDSQFPWQQRGIHTGLRYFSAEESTNAAIDEEEYHNIIKNSEKSTGFFCHFTT